MPIVARPFRTQWHAALLLGVGLGGFVDGIVLHQILQWHHMASSVPAVADDLPFNTMLDGLFHAVAWLFTVAGVVMLHAAWRREAERRSPDVLGGGLLAGWGGFQLVEGLIDHHVLGIHHAWPDGPGGVWVWDLAFLLSGVVLLGIGMAWARRARMAPGDD